MIKKIVAMMLVFILLLSSVGCSRITNIIDGIIGNTTLADENSTTETTTEAETEEVGTTLPVQTTQTEQTTETTTKSTTTTAKPTTTEITTAKPTTTKKETTTVKIDESDFSNDTLLSFSNSDLKVIKNEFFRLVNEERVRCGVSPLTENSIISSAAEIRSREIVKYYSHTRPDGTSCFSIFEDEKHYYKFRTVGENIGKKYITNYQESDFNKIYSPQDLKQIATDFFEGWKNSAPHYKNMISADYEETGFCFMRYYNEEKGELGIVGVHLFGTPL